MSTRDRFERLHAGLAADGKVRNRPLGEPPGNFLGRLWALFGPPDQVGDEGFCYRLRDRETGLEFSAYSGASGPAYGGAANQRAVLGPVLAAFDALVDATPPADCEIEYDTESGRKGVGTRGGAAFERIAAVEVDELCRALADAETELAKRSHDPWAYLGPLAALAAAWSRASPDSSASLQSRAKEVAADLLRATRDQGVRLQFAAADDPLRAPFVDAGLEQLRALAGSPLFDAGEVTRAADELTARLTSSS